MSTAIGDKPIVLTWKQAQFIRSQRRRVLYTGAWRAAKTVALCLKSVARAQNPGARELLARLHLKYLKASTMATLLYGTTTTPPMLPPGTYTHHKTDGIIRINGGGEIWCLPLDEMAKLGGTEFSGAGLDEVSDLKHREVWETVEGRCSRKVPGLPLQVYAACNPHAPTHWLYKMFDIGNTGNRLPDCHLIRTTTYDNPFLEPEYVEGLRRLTGMMYRRYVMGEWVAADGLVYGCWDRELHLIDVKPGKKWRRAFIGVDDGYSDPFCALLGLQDETGRVHIVAEKHKAGLSHEQCVEAVKYLADLAAAVGAPLRSVVVDSAAPKIIRALREIGLPAIGARKKIEEGIATTRAMMERGDLIIDPACVNLVQEIECYTYDPDTNEPIDENNHGPDAMRYMIMGIEGDEVVNVFRKPADGRAMPAVVAEPNATCTIRVDARTRSDALVALFKGDADKIKVEPKAGGRLHIWNEPVRGRRYIIGVAGGDPPASSYAVAMDPRTRRVVAELEVPPDGDAVMGIGAFIVWYQSEQSTACVMAHTTAGQALANQLAELGLPMSRGREGWRPTERGVAEAILSVRSAWDDGLIEDPSKAARKDGEWYEWNATRPEPASLRENPALRMVWADRVYARAAMLHIYGYEQPPEPNTAIDPITGREISQPMRWVS